MLGFLTQQNQKFSNLKPILGGFLDRYYSMREGLGEVDASWESFKADTAEMGSTVPERIEDLVSLYSQDITRSYGSLQAGSMVAFDYISLKGIRKSYIATVVSAYGGNGVIGNTNTKHDLLTCFLIDSGTNLDILAPVMNVIHEGYSKKKDSQYRTLSANSKSNDRININIQKKDLREKAGISKEGLQALFPSSDFRTFILNTNMIRIYRINLDG
jgi:hypothetical protein